MDLPRDVGLEEGPEMVPITIKDVVWCCISKAPSLRGSIHGVRSMAWVW